MEKIGLFVILACLFSCSEQKINMNTSHALPIEFWDIDEETANEKNVCGVTSVCFCQPRNCSDEISIPLPSETLLTDTEPNDYELLINDSNGSIIDILPFTRNTIEVEASFNINYSQFGTGSPTVFIPWNLGDPSVIGNQNPPACASKYLVIGDVTDALSDYPLTFTVPFVITTIGDNTVTPTYYLYNSDYSDFVSFVGAARSSNATFSDSFTLSPSFIAAHLVVRVSFLGTTTSAKYKLNTTTLNNGFIRKTSHYSLTFTPNDIEICDQQIRLYIRIAKSNIDDLNDFTSIAADGSLGIPWTTGSNPSVTINSSGYTEDLTTPISYHDNPVLNYNIDVQFLTNLRFQYLSSTNAILYTSSAIPLSTGNNIGTYNIQTISGTAKIGIVLQNQVFSNNNADINSISLDDDSNLLKKSDCISFKNSHPCTTLIEYRNATDFDGIENSSSPMTTFNLLVPAIFFEEQNTKEGEDIELSNDEIVRLYDKIEEKRLLQIGFMPHYMHRKLLLALSFDFVTIDGKEWIARDEYKKNDGDRHYPLKTASILLTDKNFIKENQL